MTVPPEILARGYVAGRYDQRAGRPEKPRMIPEGECVACARRTMPGLMFCTSCRGRLPDDITARISRARDDVLGAPQSKEAIRAFGRAVWSAIDYLENVR
ncbi:hypothetical protein [Oceanibaculum indicum]|uniref:Uncharacterized protein n=1 Tax=Oceanibaculum indicum P24 TaxID=1207063 RepID=K2KLW7_9PROT|nr:hypothetical protein [Oceanibaculum indicum]EKE78450.1 hypothetical protein P24_02781 [Oceanibaculum indicum P24]